MEKKDKYERLAKSLGDKMNGFIEKWGLNMGGEMLTGDVADMSIAGQLLRICFNDENTEYLFAGYVSSRIYSDFEKMFSDMGYDIFDSDGNVLFLDMKGDIK